MSNYKKLFLFIFICSGLLLWVGLNSHLYLGDEVFHYRFAKDIFHAGKRVAFDPLYGTGKPPGYFYIVEPLWHLGLVLIWKVVGFVSFPLAQLYHTLYYAALLFFVFYLSKILYDEKVGLIATFLVASIPMMVVFGILFYLDVPAATLTLIFLVLFFSKKYLWAGIIIGLMYLTKRNTCFILPAIPILLILEYKKNFLRIIKICLTLGIPAAIIIAWDTVWRMQHLGSFFKQPVDITAPSPINILSPGGMEQDFLIKFQNQFNPKFINNSNVLNPVDLVKYLGVVLFAGVVLYIFKKKFERKDLPLLLLCVTYGIFYWHFFGINSDVRYLSPVVPLIAILAAKGLLSIEKRFFKYAVIALGILQILASVSYAYMRRQLPQKEKEAFDYIRKNIPDNRLILYPETIVLEETGKIAIWGLLYLYPYFYWGSEKNIKRVIEYNNLYYIVVKHGRIYDDSRVKHLGGYPRSFVEALPSFPFVQRTYDNGAISVWAIDRSMTDKK